MKLQFSQRIPSEGKYLSDHPDPDALRGLGANSGPFSNGITLSLTCDKDLGGKNQSQIEVIHFTSTCIEKVKCIDKQDIVLLNNNTFFSTEAHCSPTSRP